jgi:hypothetical protein
MKLPVVASAAWNSGSVSLKRKLACQEGDHLRALSAYGPSSSEVVKLDSDIGGIARHVTNARLSIADALNWRASFGENGAG